TRWRDWRRTTRTLPSLAPILFAELDQLQAALECNLRAPEKLRIAQVRCHRDAADGRQYERAQHACIRGEERGDGESSRRLPRERLSVVSDGFADPVEHAEEMKLHMRMRIDETLREPGRRATY